MPSPNRDTRVFALLGLIAVLVILLISGLALYLSYRHPALAQPLTVAASVAAALVTAVGVTLARR